MKKGLAHAYRNHWPEYLFFNLCCFAVILGIAFFFKTNLKPLHPLKKGLDDFSFTDIYYKLNKPDQALKKHAVPAQPELFVVNIGNLDRSGLAVLLERVVAGQPAVTALDVVFHPDADTAGTQALARALAGMGPLVQGYIAAGGKHCEEGTHSLPALVAGREGFVNLPGNDPASDVVRYFKPYHQRDLSLAVQTAHEYLTPRREDWNRRQRRLFAHLEQDTSRCYSGKKFTIRYTWMLTDPYNSQVLGPDQVLSADFDPGVFRDKIVLLGYRGEASDHHSGYGIHPAIDEDMYFTPLNKNMTGRSYPDMYGVDVQAQILSNVLRGNYIVRLPDFWSWAAAFLISLLFTPLMIYFFVQRHLWFHIVAKLLQLGLSIAFVGIGIGVFAAGFYWNTKPIVISAILLVDLMYFYDAFVKMIARRRPVRSVFLEGHA